MKRYRIIHKVKYGYARIYVWSRNRKSAINKFKRLFPKTEIVSAKEEKLEAIAI